MASSAADAVAARRGENVGPAELSFPTAIPPGNNQPAGPGLPFQPRSHETNHKEKSMIIPVNHPSSFEMDQIQKVLYNVRGLSPPASMKMLSKPNTVQPTQITYLQHLVASNLKRLVRLTGSRRLEHSVHHSSSAPPHLMVMSTAADKLVRAPSSIVGMLPTMKTY